MTTPVFDVLPIQDLTSMMAQPGIYAVLARGSDYYVNVEVTGEGARQLSLAGVPDDQLLDPTGWHPDVLCMPLPHQRTPSGALILPPIEAQWSLIVAALTALNDQYEEASTTCNGVLH